MILTLIALCASLTAIFCGRQAQWHNKEAEYWARINALINEHAAVVNYYQELLTWTAEHKPGLLRRALKWESPEVRRGFPEPSRINVK